MKKTDELTGYFHKNAQLFSKITHFSDKPGIYTIHFMGKAFPEFKLTPKVKEIIYIGKTESSQTSRDANTHFASGKSGSSTLRRSIGALMLEGGKLRPIPRSQNVDDSKRFTNYKFDEESEAKITNWMRNNLGLSFYEFTGSVQELDTLESEIIQAIVPLLNIDRKNPANPHLTFIKAKRALCVELAKSNSNYSLPPKTNTSISGMYSTYISNSGGLYIEIWEACLPIIKKSLLNSENCYLQLEKSFFDSVGDRAKYSFRLDIENRNVQNNIGGSAVARDLNKVLNSDPEIIRLLNQKRLLFRLNSQFYFSMEIL